MDCLRLDIIAEDLVGFLVQWQSTSENVIQQQGKETNSFKESTDEEKTEKVAYMCVLRV